MASHLRMLLIAKFYMPGSGDRTYMFSLESILKSQGHEVAHFAMHHPYELKSPYTDYFTSYVSYGDVRKGISPVKIGKMFFRTLYSTEAAKKVKELIEQFKPDIVHIQHLDTHLTYSILPQIKKLGVPVVWTLHIYAPLCINYNLFDERRAENCCLCKGGKFYQPVLRRCKKGSLKESAMGAIVQYFNYYVLRYKRFVDAFICPSQYVKRVYVKWGFNEDNLHVIPNFGETESIQPTYGQGIYGLYAGRFAAEKGIRELLYVLKGTNVPFVFVGDGPLRDEVVSRIRNELGDQVTYVGFKSGEEYHDVLRGAQFLVVPSQWHEPFGLVALDAYAHGKPVIASSTGGLSDIVENDETGYLFDMTNRSELREKIQLLYGNQEQLLRMGRNARRKAETVYNPTSHYEKLMHVCASVMH